MPIRKIPDIRYSRILLKKFVENKHDDWEKMSIYNNSITYYNGISGEKKREREVG